MVAACATQRQTNTTSAVAVNVAAGAEAVPTAGVSAAAVYNVLPETAPEVAAGAPSSAECISSLFLFWRWACCLYRTFKQVRCRGSYTSRCRSSAVPVLLYSEEQQLRNTPRLKCTLVPGCCCLLHKATVAAVVACCSCVQMERSHFGVAAAAATGAAELEPSTHSSLISFLTHAELAHMDVHSVIFVGGVCFSWM